MTKIFNKLRNHFIKFLDSDKDYPVLAGFICGFYPFCYFYSEKFSEKNSLEHLVFFSLFFIGSSILVFLISSFLFNRVKFLKPYKKQMFFVLIIFTVSVGLSEAIYLKLMKKVLVLILIAAVALSFKFSKQNKKLLVLVIVMNILPFGKSLISFYDSLKPMVWLSQPDDIESVVFKKKPNIYLIQPDGYVAKEVMELPPYSYESDLYNWLESKSFKLYPNFRSNYPATLLSNASMFGMKQHYFGDVVFPEIQMINAKDVISGNNPVISIFKRNMYTNVLIAFDEYFQMNNCEQKYDYRNIELNEIPYFSHGSNVRKDVFYDVKEAFKSDIESPRFFFIENLMPHHIITNADYGKLEEERLWYLERIEQANIWLKEVISFIDENDKNCIIIILADHGGMVDIETYKEKYTNDNPNHFNSIFSNLAAIKWNGYLENDFDKELKSNVNLFRILFSVLSENKKYLNHLEDDSSFNLNYENHFYNSVYKAFDDEGKMLLK